MFSDFYYINSSVEVYRLKLILPRKNIILVMTKSFNKMLVPKRSGRSAFFHSQSCDNQSLTYIFSSYPGEQDPNASL